jgi:hypothetical protein
MLNKNDSFINDDLTNFKDWYKLKFINNLSKTIWTVKLGFKI